MANQTQTIRRGFENAGKGIDSILGAAFTAVGRAEGIRKHANIEFLAELSEQPNVEFDFGVSLIGIDKPLKVQASMPVFALTDLTDAALDTMNVEMSLDIQDTQESAIASDTAIKAEGSGKIGIGPFGAKVHISASTAVHAERKRKTDQRAHMGMSAVLKRTPPPEGVQLIVDTGNILISKAMDMNLKIIEMQAQQMESDVDAKGNEKPQVEQLGPSNGNGEEATASA